MRIYRISNQTACTVDGQNLTMKRRSREREDSINQDGLALSILCDAIGDDEAMFLAHDFNGEVIKKLRTIAEITSEDIEEWRDYHAQMQLAVQTAEWAPVESGPPKRTILASHFPKLLLNPNYRLNP